MMVYQVFIRDTDSDFSYYFTVTYKNGFYSAPFILVKDTQNQTSCPTLYPSSSVNKTKVRVPFETVLATYGGRTSECPDLVTLIP